MWPMRKSRLDQSDNSRRRTIYLEFQAKLLRVDNR